MTVSPTAIVAVQQPGHLGVRRRVGGGGGVRPPSAASGIANLRQHCPSAPQQGGGQQRDAGRPMHPGQRASFRNSLTVEGVRISCVHSYYNIHLVHSFFSWIRILAGPVYQYQNVSI